MNRPVVHRWVFNWILSQFKDLVKLVANLNWSILHFQDNISFVLIFLNEIKAVDTLDDKVSLEKVDIGHLVFEKIWLDKYRNSLFLLVKLDEVIAVNSFDDEVSLIKVSFSHGVLSQVWLN